MIYPRLILAALCWPLALSAQLSGSSDWAKNIHLSATATTNWLENASRTSDVATRKDAALHEVTVAIAHPRQLASAWLLQTSLQADYQHEPTFSLNDRTSLSARASLQHKFGLGPYAPTLQGTVALLYQDARFSGNTGWTTTASLQLAKRFTSALGGKIFGEWREHEARSWVFDVSQHTYGLEMFWTIKDRWRLTAHTARLSGDLVANAAPRIWAQALNGELGSRLSDYYRTVAQDTTQLYGPRWVSYNVEAHADLWWLALSHQFNTVTSLELRTGGAKVTNRIDITYPSRHWSLSLNHQF